MRKPQEWRIRNKNHMLLSVMKELAGDAQISFEGDLRKLHLAEVPSASGEETAVLKRNTLWSKQDFVIVPLEPGGIKSIITAIGGTIPDEIEHIQIAKAGKLEFGAYDNFHPHAIAMGDALGDAFLDSLITEEVLQRK
jgi:hypothetical protein